MTATTLTVPAPSLKYRKVGADGAALEQPVTVGFGPVALPGGTAIADTDLGSAAALVFRSTTASGPTEVWNPQTKAWQPTASTDLLKLAGIPLEYKAGAPSPWEGMLTAVGTKDARDNPQFAEAVGHYPQYRVRGSFRAMHDGLEFTGLSVESQALEFLSAIDNAPFAVQLTPKPPADATNVRLVLRNAAKQAVGSLEIDASGVVTIANRDAGGAALSSITLASSGDIVLAPAAGRKVIVAGDLEAEHITYRPSGGGAKQVL